jgi:ornithine cyclodeaminase/alanine dehydrogenase-like protein (mu-crystallin family)
VIGTGFQAASQIEAVRSVCHLSEVRVYGRNKERRYRFAEENDARAAGSAEEAVSGADIIVTATYSKDPVLEADWIAPGTHINAMGSNQAAKREVTREVLDRCSLIIVDSIEQSKVEAGDLIANGFDWSDPRLREIKDVTARPVPGGITMFKSNGLGLEDVAVAAWVYERLLGA